MTERHTTFHVTTGRQQALRLGDRVRQLRAAAGMTQTQLADERFSKEYVSQIERGKTRPTRETVEWLAHRLGVDPGFLESGISSDERVRVEAALARAEALSTGERYDEAVQEFERLATAVLTVGSPQIEVRALAGEAWARMELGDLRQALDLLSRARTVSEGPDFSDLDRADVLFRLGVCRYLLSSVTSSHALLSEALKLAEQSGFPCDLLRSNIFAWRSRCYRRQRDFEAAREDVERALELAVGLNDRRAVADAYFEASLVAERCAQWLLARTYAEQAKTIYEEISDRTKVGRLLNNLGGLNFLLGKPEEAIAFLKDAFRILIEVGTELDAGHVVCSFAEVHLGLGEAKLAEEHARHALQLIGESDEGLHEAGNALLVLGRALTLQDRLDEAAEALQRADRIFEQVGSLSHRAATWIADGDVRARRGDDAEAARLYRKAAEALQDVHF